jgi:hypothetical protein
MAIEGATDAEAFEAYVEHFLAPTLKERGRWCLIGSGHTGHRGSQSSSKKEGRSFCFCDPTLSPDLDSMEEALSKIKGIVRKLGARTCETLVEAIESWRVGGCRARRCGGLVCPSWLWAAGSIFP